MNSKPTETKVGKTFNKGVTVCEIKIVESHIFLGTTDTS